MLPVVAFTLAAWSSDSIFDRLPRTEDEVTFLFQAKTIAEGHLVAPGPDQPRFFFMSFVVVRDGEWFGKYPPGYPAILSFGVRAGHAWVVNALAAAVVIGLLILVGRRLYDLRTGLTGGLLLALSPFFIIQSGSLLSHVVALFWVLLMLYLFDVMRSRDLPIAAFGAGAAAGMLLLTRPLTAVGVGLPFLIVAVADLYQRRPFFRRYLLVAVGLLPFLLTLLAYNQMTTGDPATSAYELWWPYDRIGFGPEYGVNGHSLSDAVDNTRSNLRDLGEVLFGWPRRLSFLPVLLAAGAGIVRLRRGGFSRDLSIDLVLIGIVIGVVGVHMLYWTSGKMYGPRYYFATIGALSLLSARGIVWLWDAVGVWLDQAPGRVRHLRLMLPCLLIAAVAFNLLVTLPGQADRYRGWNGVHRDDLSILRSHELENALVFVPRPDWQTYAPLFLENSTTLDSDIVYAIDRGAALNTLLMDDFPGRNFYRYRDGRLIALDAETAFDSCRHCGPRAGPAFGATVWP